MQKVSRRLLIVDISLTAPKEETAGLGRGKMGRWIAPASFSSASFLSWSKSSTLVARNSGAGLSSRAFIPATMSPPFLGFFSLGAFLGCSAPAAGAAGAGVAWMAAAGSAGVLVDETGWGADICERVEEKEEEEGEMRDRAGRE